MNFIISEKSFSYFMIFKASSNYKDFNIPWQGYELQKVKKTELI